MSKPKINWIKNNPNKHRYFIDGSTFLVAVQVSKNGGTPRWEFNVVRANCDGEGMFLEHINGESYDDWLWEDLEYFHLIEGNLPVPTIEELQ